jgi:large subunit ribosomal protein L18
MKMNKTQRRQRIQKRYRDTVLGTSNMPRMSVFRSNKEIYAQIINDESGVTLVAVSSRDKEFAEHSGNKIELAQKVGKAIGEKAVAAGISAIRFDRGGYLYHGRVKSLADGAREAGLNF